METPPSTLDGKLLLLLNVIDLFDSIGMLCLGGAS